jgi:hypothetical protein
MTRKLIVVAVSAVLVVALARTGEAKGIPQEKGVRRAYVLGDGSFQSHSKEVLAVAKSGTGSYLITMKKALANCAVTATITDDGNENGGSISTFFAGAVSPQTIGVFTFDGAGSFENRDFFLIVACTP